MIAPVRHADAWPTCPKDGNPVATGKDGQPLKNCETHTDRRPSAAARQPSFGTPRPAPKPAAKPTRRREPGPMTDAERVAKFNKQIGYKTPRQKANEAIAARLAATPEPIVALRADRNQVIVTLTAVGSTDAQAKAKAAARAAGHRINGHVASIGGGEAGSRKAGEWKITLDLSAKRAGHAVETVLDERPTGAAAVLAGGARIAEETEVAEPIPTGPVKVVEAVTGSPILVEKVLAAIDAGTYAVPVRLHKKHGYLATVRLWDRTIYRYGAEDHIAADRMIDALRTLAKADAQHAELRKRANRAQAAADRATAG